MTTDHDFTEAEQAAIEKAAADHLEFNFAPSDAREIAYDIAQAIRSATFIAAHEDAAEAMDNAESLEARSATVSSQRNRFGLKLAAKLLREQAAAIRADLDGGAQ